MRQWSLSPGLRHLVGFMPVMTTTPDFRPVLWKMALPVLSLLRQQTKPRPRWRDLKPGTRPPAVFLRLSPADHSVFSILSVLDNMGAGIPAIHEHRRRASLSESNSATSGPPKGSLTQSTIPPASSLTGTLCGRCSRLWLNLARHPSHSHTMTRSGLRVQRGLLQWSTPRKTLAPTCLTPSMRIFWLIADHLLPSRLYASWPWTPALKRGA